MCASLYLLNHTRNARTTCNQYSKLYDPYVVGSISVCGTWVYLTDWKQGLSTLASTTVIDVYQSAAKDLLPK